MGVDKEFLKKHWMLIVLGLILLLGFGLRIYFFAQTVNQPLWWDEADYMVLAKKLGTDTLSEYTDYTEIWSPRRPFFLPVAGAIMFKIGLGEVGTRFLAVIFSMFAIWLTYLLGKELFNKKIGLIAAFGISVFWLQLFFNSRITVGLPASTFVLAGIYFFWRGYVKKESNKFIYLGALFLGLALFTRHTTVLTAIPILFLVLMREKLRFLKNKHLWISIFIIFLILLPNIIYLFSLYENPLEKGTGIGEGRFAPINAGTIPAILNYFGFFSVYLGWIFLFVFLVGCLKLLDVVLGYDMIFKNINLQKYIFLFLWIITYIVFFGYIGGEVGQPMPLQPRYLIFIFPAVFMFLGIGLMKIYDVLKKYHKVLALVVVLCLLFFGGYYQVSHSHDIIMSKKYSYWHVKEAALWMKENSNEDDAIITNSVPQTIYYAERKVKYFDTPEEYVELRQEYNLRYFVASVFENSPKKYHEIPEKYGLKPVKVYFSDAAKTDPVLVIYEFPEDHFN